MTIRVVAALLALVLSAPAYAQQYPRVEVSGGFSHLRTGLDPTEDPDLEADLEFLGIEGNPFGSGNGWLASVTGNFTPAFGITGEVGRQAAGADITGFEIDGNLTFSFFSFMFGPRFAARSSSSVTPWGQVLFGAVRSTATATAGSESESFGFTSFAIQPGGGVDIWVSRNLGIRGGADWRRILEEGGALSQFRVHAGIVLAGGRR